MPLTGLILSGGKSGRMGHDKGLIEYHGKSQREYLFELLGHFCQHVYTSCKTGADVPSNLYPLYDEFDLESPLNGILTGMKRHPNHALLTVPVDMPMINKFSVSYLLTHRDAESCATCFYDSDGKYPDPLFCIWETHSFSKLSQFFSSGGISPRKFLLDHQAKLLSPTRDLNVNINTPEDLDQYRKRFSGDQSA